MFAVRSNQASRAVDIDVIMIRDGIKTKFYPALAHKEKERIKSNE